MWRNFLEAEDFIGLTNNRIKFWLIEVFVSEYDLNALVAIISRGNRTDSATQPLEILICCFLQLGTNQ